MEQNTSAHSKHSHDQSHSGSTKEIWRTFWILLGLTLVELVLGYVAIGMPPSGLLSAIKGAIIILMLAKAFYIVAYFMHLKHEVKNLIMTIIVPLLLFVWFIIAFLRDGSSYKDLRNEYDPYFKQKSTEKVEKKEHGAGDHKEEAPAKKEGAMD